MKKSILCALIALILILSACSNDSGASSTSLFFSSEMISATEYQTTLAKIETETSEEATTIMDTSTIFTETTTHDDAGSSEIEQNYENLSDMFEELMPFMDSSRGYFYGKSDIRQYTDADYEQLVGVHFRVVEYDDSYVGTWCTRWDIEIIEVYGEERYEITEDDYECHAQMYIKGKPTTHLYGRPIPEVGKEYFRYITKEDLLDANWGVGLYLSIKEEDGVQYLYGYGIDLSVFDGAMKITDESENQIYKPGTHDKVIAYLNQIGQELPTFDYKCELWDFLYGLGILKDE